MGIILIILGIALIVLSAVLMLAKPVVGLLGIAGGVLCIVYGRKNRKPQGEKTDDTRVFIVTGYNYRQDELKAFLTEKNDEYALGKKAFIEETFGKVYEYYPEWRPAKLVAENNEHDPDAIAVYVDDIKIGYIAKEDKEEIRSLDVKSIEAEFYGGRYKEAMSDEYGESYTIETGETPYKAKLYVKI